MTDDWSTAVAAERMELDQEFTDRVDASSFNRQQWGLVMTAIEFDVENPSDPESARIVPDTSSLPAILPELDKIGQGGPAMGGQPGDDGGSSGGLVDAVKGLFSGSGGGSHDEEREEAEQLASEYAERLQEKLEANGRWESVRERAEA